MAITIGTYTARQGQSIYDICLQTYGTLDLIYKLIQDNGISNIMSYGFSGIVFNYDSSLISNNSTVIKNGGIPYITDLYSNQTSNGSYNSDYSDDYDN